MRQEVGVVSLFTPVFSLHSAYCEHHKKKLKRSSNAQINVGQTFRNSNAKLVGAASNESHEKDQHVFLRQRTYD